MESNVGLFGTLPPTVRDAILEHLNLYQLKGLRTTSRGLKRLVDESPSFVNRCYGDIPYGTVLDRSYEPAIWVPVHQLRIKHCTVISVSAWWPRLAEHLTYIYIDHSGLMLSALADILRHSPNVATLGLHHLRLINPTDHAEKYANFRLTKLTYFSIGKVHEQIAELMRLVINPPQLTNFGCVWDHEPDDDEQLIVDFLEASQATLKYIGLSPTQDMLEQMGNFERFNPIAVTLYCSRFQVDHVVNFTRKVNSMTRLILEEIILSDQMLREIGLSLPNLKELNVCITASEIWKPSFLDAVPKLEFLAVQHKPSDNFTYSVPYLSFLLDRASPKTIGDFAECPRSPHLKEIILTGIVPKPNLNDYLSQSPNLHSVTFDFPSESFSTLLLTVPLIKLKHLTLRTMSIPALEGIGAGGGFPNLTELTLVRVDMPSEIFQPLLAMCPALETVRILSIADDDDVRFMCVNLPRLRNLELFQCPLTDASIGHILSHGHRLEKLHISSCYDVSEAAQRQLKALGRIWVQ